MSIYTLDLRTFKQNFDCKKENKERYGEVNTDFNLINQLLDLLPRKLFTNPKLKLSPERMSQIADKIKRNFEG